MPVGMPFVSFLCPPNLLFQKMCEQTHHGHIKPPGWQSHFSLPSPFLMASGGSTRCSDCGPGPGHPQVASVWAAP